MTADRDLLKHAAQVCTLKELEAFVLWHQGAGHRRIARQLGISPTAVRDRIERAQAKLDKHLLKGDAA